MKEKPQKLFTSLSKKESVLGEIYTWSSAERFWVPRDKAWFVSYSIFFILIIMLAIILGVSFFQNALGAWLFVLAIVSFAFLWFIQATIPPERTLHEINKLGIKTFGKLYKWKDIAHFWFSAKHGIVYLHLDLYSKDNPSADSKPRLTLLVENEEDLDIFMLLIRQVDYGDKNEVGFNMFAKFIHGKYIPIMAYLPDDVLTQEEFLEQEQENTSKDQ